MGISRSNNCSNFNISILLICFTCYILNELFLKKLGISFFNSHFNDLLATPILMAVINILDTKKILNNKSWFFIIVGASVWWEFITPLYLKNSVTDIIDFMCYIIGFFLYIIIEKIKNIKKV